MSTTCLLRGTGLLLFILVAGCGGGGSDSGKGGTGPAGLGGAGGILGTAGTTGGGGVDGIGGTVGVGGSNAGGSGGTGGALPTTFTVLGGQTRLVLDACNLTAATLPNVPAGNHTITLTASTLSKGFLQNATAQDNYVIVELPLPAGDPDEKHRFFTLNGVNDHLDFTLPAPGTVRVMFVDSDIDYNSGTATVAITPDNLTATVDAMTNLLRYDQGCGSNGASLVVSYRAHRLTLTASTLSSGPGAMDPYVLVRLPVEEVNYDFRFLTLNGVGDSVDFITSGNTDFIRAWFITATGTSSGSATLTVTDL